MLNRFKPSPAMAVACTALVVALGGSAYAVTQLPPNSVGPAQLKKNAVTSPKIKDGTIVGADVNESKLGKVPRAKHADTAAGASHAASADSAGHAATADTATSAGDASTLGGKTPNAFVSSTQSAGGVLTGPFSNLSFGPGAVTGPAVAGETLDQSKLSDVEIRHFQLSFAGISEDSDPLGQFHGFSLEFHGTKSGSNLTCALNISGPADYSVTSTAQNGDSDATGLASTTGKKLVSIGPTSARHIQTGVFAAFSTANRIQGQVTMEGIPATTTCDLSLAMLYD